MPKVYINGFEYFFNVGETILSIAERNGIYIPTLCYHHKIKPTGACRICLVEVEGYNEPQAACETYAVDGMKIYLDTPKVIDFRKDLLNRY